MQLQRGTKMFLRFIFCALLLFSIMHFKKNKKYSSNCVSATPRSDAEITFDILKSGEDLMDFNSQTDLIVLVGVTGSGKSTLVHLLAGDNDQLFGETVDDINLIFVDKDDKIGVPTINSKTLIPQVTKDLESNSVFIDCPGFFDTRNTSLDIAGGYLTKRVFDKAERVKIVLTLSYTSVTFGQDRRGLTDLLSYLVTLINEVDKFKGGIALIVTKVDVPASDEKIVRAIENFLLKSKETLTERLEDSEKLKVTKNMIKLINFILDKSSGSKIGVFRTPNVVGPVTKSQYLQEERQLIRKIIFENLNFIKKYPNYVNYKISIESQLHIKNVLLNIIDEKIKNEMMKISEAAKKFYKLMGNSNTNLTAVQFQIKISNDKSEFEKLAKEVTDSPSIIIQNYFKVLSKILNTSFEIFNIDRLDVLGNFNIILKFVQYSSSFREIINVDDSSSYTKIWLEPVLDFEIYLTLLDNWYTFIMDFYTAISHYEIQKNKINHIHKFSNQNITKTNLRNFLLIMHDMKLKNSATLHNLVASNLSNIDDFIIRDLNKVFQIASYFVTVCENHNLKIQAYFVTLSEIITKYQNISCPEPIRSITIFVLDTILFDTNVDFTGMEIDLLIFAKKWDIIGENRHIVLDGENAEVIEPKTAQNGTAFGENGHNGQPGKNGQSSGNFYGIGFEFIEGKILKISMKGGNGSDGQNGGNGANGKKGSDLEIPTTRSKAEFENLKIQIRNYGLSLRSDNLINNEEFYIPLIYSNKRDTQNYYISGSRLEGSSGGSGGHGGKSGQGGLAGNFKLIELGRNSGVISETSNGNPGNVGKGGTGGQKGHKLEISIKCEMKTQYLLGSLTLTDDFHCWRNSPLYTNYTDGHNGIDNLIGISTKIDDLYDVNTTYEVCNDGITCTHTDIKTQMMDSTTIKTYNVSIELKINDYKLFVKENIDSMLNYSLYDDFLSILYELSSSNDTESSKTI